MSMTSTSAAVAVPQPSTPSTSSSSECLLSNSNTPHTNTTSTTAATPVRHNYAAPHTPIASVKRPRSTNNNNNSSNNNNNNQETPLSSKLSPLHPPRPVTTRTIVETQDEEKEPLVVITTTTTSSSSSSSTSASAPSSPTASSTDSNHSPSSSNNNNNNDDCHHQIPHSDSNASASTWVGRQVDALFSPVLNFLHHNTSTSSSSSSRHDQDQQHPTTPSTSSSEEEDVAVVTDEDVTMEDVGPVEVERVHSESPPTVIAAEEDPIVAAEHHQQEGTEESHHHHHHNHNHHVADHTVTTTTTITTETVDHSTDPAESTTTTTTVEQQHVDDDEDEFNPYLFIKSLPPYELVAPFRPPIALPPKMPQAPPISLILDLDETLVHCSVEGTSPLSMNSNDPPPPPDLTFPVLFHGMTYQVQVRLRPHLFTFLEAIAQKFEVVVFTASQKVYADELLNLLDPENKYIHHRLFRESCLPVEGNFLKDLNVLGRDLRQTVLVDNSPHAFGYQIDNGIPIESWFEDPHDTELLKLEQFLTRQLLGADDVRNVVRQQFQTFQRVAQS